MLRCGTGVEGHLHTKNLGILRKRDGTSITFEEAVSDFDVCTVGKAQQFAHPKAANHKVPGLSSCATGT